MSNEPTGSPTLAALRRGDLAGVGELNLAGAGLQAFPREVLGLAESLEVLDLSHNGLTSLPADFNRLTRLRILFCSGNAFARLPPVLGECAALAQVGFRGCGMREVPGEALPPSLRWLILTDNAVDALPASLGERPALQKVMLAGNRLRHLPESLAGAAKLELLRLSANHLAALPAWLAEMPSLAWLGWAGNPLGQARPAACSDVVAWADLEVGALLGQGASGLVYDVRRAGQPAALKLFKGVMTSDGLPESEMAACLSAGQHPNLLSALATMSGHPEQRRGLLMPLLPPGWRALARPPSLATCSRDVYDPPQRFSLDVALRISHGVGSAALHLHRRGMLHGDLYAHNILWDGLAGGCVLSDFGAASFLPQPDDTDLAKVEVLAWGVLLGELLDRCGGPPGYLRDLQRDCVRPNPSERPTMQDAVAALGSGL